MSLTIFQYVLLGIIQGITEWLPVSSSGIVTIINSTFFKITDISKLIHIALFLHLGTFLAALIYFRKEVLKIIKTIFKYKYEDESSKRTLKFLIISTIISGALGLMILKIIENFKYETEITGKLITFSVGILLLVSGFIQIKAKNNGLKKERQLKNSDGIVLGFAQGISTLPGISRSGITISSLLLKNFDDTTAIRLSFLMSLPIIFFGNLLLNLSDFMQIFTLISLYGLIMSFLFGLVTIHALMKLSKKINFGYFLIIFAVLMLFSLLVV